MESARSSGSSTDQSARRLRSTDDHGPALDDAVHSQSLVVAEVLDGGEQAVATSRLGGDGPRDRVLGAVLERPGDAQDLLGGLAGGRDDLDDRHDARS